VGFVGALAGLPVTVASDIELDAFCDCDDVAPPLLVPCPESAPALAGATSIAAAIAAPMTANPGSAIQRLVTSPPRFGDDANAGEEAAQEIGLGFLGGAAGSAPLMWLTHGTAAPRARRMIVAHGRQRNGW
jgi:hypothetical protein